MADPTSVNAYAQFLAECIRDALGIPLPDSFEQRFVFHANRLSSADYEDLGSLVLLECQEQQASGRIVDGREVYRIVDRLRHQLVRKSRREVASDITNHLPAETTISPSKAESVISDFVQQLSPTEFTVFDLRCLQGHEAKQIASATGLSTATVYRHLASVRKRFEAFVREG